MGANGVIHTSDVRTDENDAGVDRRRRQDHAHVSAGVDANARTHGRACYSLLTTHQNHLLSPAKGSRVPRPSFQISRLLCLGQHTLRYGL